jgi:hypothetical protein
MALALACVVVGCSDKGPSPVFGTCSDDKECETGLFCAQGGALKGHCARFCSEDSECVARYGINHLCGDAVCVQVCGWLSGCRNDGEVSFSSLESCGDGLRCRAESNTQCASQCAATSWGEVSRSVGPSSRNLGGSLGSLAGGVGGASSAGGIPGGFGGVAGGIVSGPAGGTPTGITGSISGGTPGAGPSGTTPGAAPGGITPGGTLAGTVAGPGGSASGTTGGATPGGIIAGLDAGVPGDAAVDAESVDAAPPSPQPCTSLPGVNDYTALGPFDGQMFTQVGPSNGFTLFRPSAALGRDGFRHPIAVFSVGFLLYLPTSYEKALRHLASHGFVIIACDDYQKPGCLEQGMQWLAEQNQTSGSMLKDKLDVTREAVLSHGIGATRALAAADRAAVKAVVSLHPILTTDVDAGVFNSFSAPHLIVNSTGDTMVTTESTAMLFAASSVPPTFYAVQQDTNVGHNHFQNTSNCLMPPCGDGAKEVGPVAAWLRLWLCDDQGARQLFRGSECTLCKTPWVAQRKPTEIWQ